MKAKVGRPSAFKPEYCEQARKLCLLGLIDKELAEYFEVAESTLNKWKLDHPEFSESLKKGKQIADAEVSASLYHRAVGYEHDDIDIRVIDSVVVKTDIRKIYPPETVAAIFWLKNRQLGKWRDKVEQDVKVTHRTLAEELAELNAKSNPAGD